MPKVSVITTVYNGEGHLREAIQSVLDQEYGDYEYIIVDDGSTDGTGAVVTSFRDARIVYLPIARSGRGVALNKALEAARGDYIAVLDADDIAFGYRLRRQVNFLDDHADCQVLCGNNKIMEPTPAPDVSDAWRKIEAAEFARRNVVSHSTVMMRARALRSVGGYDAARKCLFDYELWYRLASAGCAFYKLDSALVFKRIHGGQFFEGKNRFHVLVQSVTVKLCFYRRFSRRKSDIFYIVAGFVYGLLPAFVRRKFMEKLK